MSSCSSRLLHSLCFSEPDVTSPVSHCTQIKLSEIASKWLFAKPGTHMYENMSCCCPFPPTHADVTQLQCPEPEPMCAESCEFGNIYTEQNCKTCDCLETPVDPCQVCLRTCTPMRMPVRARDRTILRSVSVRLRISANMKYY